MAQTLLSYCRRCYLGLQQASPSPWGQAPPPKYSRAGAPPFSPADHRCALVPCGREPVATRPGPLTVSPRAPSPAPWMLLARIAHS